MKPEITLRLYYRMFIDAIFEYLLIRNHDAEQKPFILFYYYDDVVRSRGRCHNYIKSME